MRVALITNNVLPPREGIGRHVVELARHLSALGIEPLILAKGRSLRRWRRLEVEGLKVALYPYAPIRPFHQEAIRAVLQPWLDAGADGADLLHLHLPLLPRLRAGLPRLVTFHSPLLADTAAIREPGIKAALIKANARLFGQAYEHAQIRAADAIIAVSGSVRDELERHYHLAGHRPTVITNGVDSDFFTPGERRANAAAILYVGRLGYRKGLFRLLDAFARLGEGPASRLELAGEGPLRARLEARARTLGIAGRVHFLGFLDRPALRQALHRAALLVNPADYESGPLTLLEAMAAGTPVVTTRTGIVADLGEAPPLTLAESDSADIARKITAVLASPALAEARAGLARLLVEERFSWRAVAARHAALYRQLARRAA